MFKKSFFTIAIVGLLSGCGSMLNTAGNSTFSCQGEGGCPTPFEVYEDTHASSGNVRNGRTPEKWGVNGVKKSGGSRNDFQLNNEQKNKNDLDLLKNISPADILAKSNSSPKPIREESRVMRIWVAPWIDQGDNLNWSGYVYTEITPRKWSFGEKEIRYQGGVPDFLPNFKN